MAKKRTMPGLRNAQKKADKKAAKKAKAQADRPKMATAAEIENLRNLLHQTGDHPLWSIRGHAIQSYANLEQSLCRLFAEVSGTTLDIASIIFFKITSSSARDTILDKLMEKKYGDTHSVFWKSAGKIIATLTQTRNHIVHWNVANLNKDGISGLVLMVPNIFDWVLNRTSEPPITIVDILEFNEKCHTVTRLCHMFFCFHHPHLTTTWTPELRQAWRDIFQQPIEYPIPDNHPLSQTTIEPETPPPPSQELPGS